MTALLAAKQRAEPGGWQAFEREMSSLKLRRTRVSKEARDALAALVAAEDGASQRDIARVALKLRLVSM